MWFFKEERRNDLISVVKFGWKNGWDAVNRIYEEDEFDQTECQRTKILMW